MLVDDVNPTMIMHRRATGIGEIQQDGISSLPRLTFLTLEMSGG